MHHSIWYPCTKQKAVDFNRHNLWNTKPLDKKQGLNTINVISFLKMLFLRHICLLYIRKINSNILLAAENIAILPGSFNKDTYKKGPRKELLLLNLPFYNFIRCVYWKISSTFSFPVWLLYAISFHNFFTFLLSFLLFLCLFSPWGPISVVLIVFYFALSIAVSPLPSNQMQILYHSYPSLSWPDQSSPCHQPWLLSSLPLFTSYIWSPLYLHHIHHLHVYCYLELFLESQLHFSHDLESLNSLWPAPFSCWLCWTPAATWQSFCCSFLLSHYPVCNNQLFLLHFY